MPAVPYPPPASTKYVSPFFVPYIQIQRYSRGRFYDVSFNFAQIADGSFRAFMNGTVRFSLLFLGKWDGMN